MEIYENILETLGNTPLVKLGRFFPGPATLAAKVESFNPGSSVKDRIGIAMIEAGEKPPLMLYLVWTDYTRLAKEVAATGLSRAIERGAAPSDLDALVQTMGRLQHAGEPDDLAS